jgi:hypothetical protein
MNFATITNCAVQHPMGAVTVIDRITTGSHAPIMVDSRIMRGIIELRDAQYQADEYHLKASAQGWEFRVPGIADPHAKIDPPAGEADASAEQIVDLLQGAKALCLGLTKAQSVCFYRKWGYVEYPGVKLAIRLGKLWPVGQAFLSKDMREIIAALGDRTPTQAWVSDGRLTVDTTDRTVSIRCVDLPQNHQMVELLTETIRFNKENQSTPTCTISAQRWGQMQCALALLNLDKATIATSTARLHAHKGVLTVAAHGASITLSNDARTDFDVHVPLQNVMHIDLPHDIQIVGVPAWRDNMIYARCGSMHIFMAMMVNKNTQHQVEQAIEPPLTVQPSRTGSDNVTLQDALLMTSALFEDRVAQARKGQSDAVEWINDIHNNTPLSFNHLAKAYGYNPHELRQEIHQGNQK